MWEKGSIARRRSQLYRAKKRPGGLRQDQGVRDSNRIEPQIEGVASTGDGASPIAVEVPNDNRPHVRIYVGHNRALGLLDSGASISLITQKTLRELLPDHPIIRPSNTVIRTADGAQHHPLGTITLSVKLRKRSRDVVFHVMDRLQRPLICGMNFWDAFGITIADCGQIEEVQPGAVRGAHQLSATESQELERIKKMFPITPEGKLNVTPLITHAIETGEALPIRQRPYVFSPYVQAQLHEEIDRMVALDIIEPSPSPSWLNPILPVKKPNGKIRICMDARRLNHVTVKDAYPPQSINRILSNLQGTRYLSAIDLKDAYYQIELRESDREKTSFAVISKGAYRYKRMPMGLCNSGATWTKLMDQIVGSSLEPYAFVYLDDLIVATHTFEKHLEVLQKIAELLRGANLTISVDKSKFCLTEITYLGYRLNERGLYADPERMRPVLEYAAPKTVREVRCFLGMAGWYRRFVKDFSHVSAPLTDLLKTKGTKIRWTPQANDAFEALKTCLTTPPILAMPDFARPFYVHTDSSDRAIGACLMQKSTDEGQEDSVIAYFSAKLNDAEKNYYTTEKECLAVVRAILHFRPYIEGAHFVVVTDHAALKWLLSFKDPTGRVARWAMRLQDFDFEIEHRKGKQHVVADALSRSVAVISLESMLDTADAEYAQLRANVAASPAAFPKYTVNGQAVCMSGKKGGPKVLVPTNWRKAVLRENHDAVTAGHGGYFKTLRKIMEHYTWEGLSRDVQRYVADCQTCKGIKPTNKTENTPMRYFDAPAQPFHRVCIDYLGPFPMSTSGNMWLLVAVDDFSKYTVVRATRKANAVTSAKFVEQEIILRHGAPSEIVSDRARHFDANIFHQMLDRYNVKWSPVPAYYPQANAAEAAIKTIGTILRAHVMKDEQHNKWDAHVAELGCALNAAVHTSTQSSPHEVLYGVPFRLSGDIQSPQLNSTDEIDRSTRILKLHQAIQKQLNAARSQSRVRYNLRVREREHSIQSQVWRRNFKLSNKAAKYTTKLAPRYLPCTVEKRIGRHTYQLRDRNGRSRIFPAKHIK